MAGLAYPITNKERAYGDVKIMLAATKKEGKVVKYKSFTAIQKEAHADRIAHKPAYRANSILIGLRPGDMASLARAVTAYLDPKILQGFDYNLAPDYDQMKDQISQDPELNGLPPYELYGFTLRRNSRPESVTQILDIALGIYYARRQIITPSLEIHRTDLRSPMGIILPAEADINRTNGHIKKAPKTQKAPDLPPLDKKIAPLKPEYNVQPYFSPAVAVAKASEYLRHIKPEEYEIRKPELRIVKALAKIVTSGGG